jgi:tRNA (guanine-N7-)-methyltransferase
VSVGEATLAPRRGHVLAPILQPSSYTERLNLDAAFGRCAPLQVDLGCGDGTFLRAMAQKHAPTNFLGIERLSGRVRRAARRIASLPNARVLYVESSYAVQYLLPKESVERFYLLFPDPWPKRRHQSRRLVNETFLHAIALALAPEGLFCLATDQRDYFQQVEAIAGTHAGFQLIAPIDLDLPVTKFEARFQATGAQIYRLTLRKISPVA